MSDFTFNNPNIQTDEKTSNYKLSDQALGAVMMALQKSLMEQSDIVPVLKGFEFNPDNGELVVLNPPILKFDSDTEEENDS
tara:strand:+ start:372 stop:614 length:243 start_codon:yes stop_codon:yes gene_type:complete